VKRTLLRALAFCLLLFLLFPVATTVSFAEESKATPSLEEVGAAYLYHLERGTAVLQKNESDPIGAGSTVKIMAGLLFCEALANRLSEKIEITPELIAAISDDLIRYLLISPVIRNVPELYRQLFENADEDMSIGGVKGFLYTISDLFYKQLDFSKEDTATRKKHLLHKILLYVDENMGQPCAITDLAKHLDYAPSYLSRFFYTNIGMPYSDYVRNIKISHACYLLRNTQESVIDIAIQCGYFSISSFNRNFKQMTSYSPTEYRKKNNHMKKESN
jgi:AraC-like DNA-binding protein